MRAWKALILANHYLENIHGYITQQIQTVEARAVSASKASDRRRLRFYEGQLEELLAARAYLSENFDLSTYNYY